MILSKLAEHDADILILTETDSRISLGERYTAISSQKLVTGYDGIEYKVLKIELPFGQNIK